MFGINATRRTPSFNQLRAHLRAGIRQSIRRRAALKGLEVRKSRVIFVTL